MRATLMSVKNYLVGWGGLLALILVPACGISDNVSSDPAVSEQTQESSGGCASDHTVTTPAKITSVTVLSSRKVRVTGTAGSDPNGPVTVLSYNFRDTNLTTHPVWPPSNPYDVTVDKLQPGMQYQLTLVSYDACNNYGNSTTWNVTMPASVSESTLPVATTPTAGPFNTFQGVKEAATIFADDDTGVDHVDFFANGASAGSYSYTDADGFTTGSPGLAYWVILDASLYGTTAFIEARTYDVFGNMRSTSATLPIPTP